MAKVEITGTIGANTITVVVEDAIAAETLSEEALRLYRKLGGALIEDETANAGRPAPS
jgi:hypothetical protein